MAAQKAKSDIVVVGGGLSGFAAAIVAARAGYSVLHLAPPAPKDLRTSALMGPSVEILTRAGLIGKPDSIGTALENIRIIDCTERLVRAPETLFAAREAGLDAFGWNFSNTKLLEAFEKACENLDVYRRIGEPIRGFSSVGDGVAVETEGGTEISCQLLVGADGKGSVVREGAGIGVHGRALPQSALVCDVELERGLDGTSVEFHYRNGPFTLVPAGGMVANLVWIDENEKLEPLRKAKADALGALFSKQSQHLFGNIRPKSGVTIFPLSQLSADTASAGRVVLVGEAAHAFPPIGAQGLNLSLRDVAALGAALEQQDKGDGWALAVAGAYAAARKSDLSRTTNFVGALFGSLVSDMIPAQMLRAGGLWALKLVPGLRKKAFSLGMGER
jgi:2-octaprenyl-6-methoxyphenol hydroxylase